MPVDKTFEDGMVTINAHTFDATRGGFDENWPETCKALEKMAIVAMHLAKDLARKRMPETRNKEWHDAVARAEQLSTAMAGTVVIHNARQGRYVITAVGVDTLTHALTVTLRSEHHCNQYCTRTLAELVDPGRYTAIRSEDNSECDMADLYAERLKASSLA